MYVFIYISMYEYVENFLHALYTLYLYINSYTFTMQINNNVRLFIYMMFILYIDNRLKV